MKRILVIAVIALSSSIFCNYTSEAQSTSKNKIKDLSYFLEQMLTLDHLPVLEDSHTAMASTWDRRGGNWDGNDFKNNDGKTNVLCDTDGPGCVFRIFTGRLENLHYEKKDPKLDLTQVHLQIFLDHAEKPFIDCPIRDFFVNNPMVSYPFVFDNLDNFKRTYPGFLLPIPFEKHLKVQLVSPVAYPYFDNWGNYWQITYKIFPKDERFKSISLPFSEQEKMLIEKVTDLWTAAETSNPQLLNHYNQRSSFALQPGEKKRTALSGQGTIKEMRIKITPDTPESWKDLRLKIFWDKEPLPSIDVPAGYFFGNADYAGKIQYSSLFIGQDSISPYCRIPMPYQKEAAIELVNSGKNPIGKVELLIADEHSKPLPNSGYLHATWTEELADSISMPKWGKQNVPSHLILERDGIKGKYIGTILHVAWPVYGWWGEGDMLVWSDEYGFPPSYHGTGTEEYFNSGWCLFDRKAISGYVKTHPGNVAVYSFHLVDNFNFSEKYRMVLERWAYDFDNQKIRAIWGSTAFWYGAYPTPAFSRQNLISPRLKDENPEKWESERWE